MYAVRQVALIRVVLLRVESNMIPMFRTCGDELMTEPLILMRMSFIRGNFCFAPTPRHPSSDRSISVDWTATISLFLPGNCADNLMSSVGHLHQGNTRKV